MSGEVVVASQTYVTVKWVLGILLTILLAVGSAILKYEHNRISELEIGRYENRDRITRLEEKLDDKLEILNYKLERLTEITQQQNRSRR